jgi:vacuolar-type H+-ATPase subunit E/Vma4
VIALDEYQQRKRQVEAFNRKADEAAGMRKRILSEMKAKFRLSTLKEAEKALERFIDERQRWYKKILKASKRFDKRYKARLEEMENGTRPESAGRD